VKSNFFIKWNIIIDIILLILIIPCAYKSLTRTDIHVLVYDRIYLSIFLVSLVQILVLFGVFVFKLIKKDRTRSKELLGYSGILSLFVSVEFIVLVLIIASGMV